MESEFGGEQICRILSVFDDISPDWFLLDRGNMLRNSSKNDEECRVCAVKEKHLKTKDKLIERLEQEIDSIKKNSGIIPAKNAAVVSAG